MYGLTWNRGLFYVVSTIFLSALISIISLNYTDAISILICMCAGLLFGLFLLNKVFVVLQPPQPLSTNTIVTQTRAHEELSKNDYIIGFVHLVYADFSFVLLLLLFVMLAMIKAFTYKNNS